MLKQFRPAINSYLYELPAGTNVKRLLLSALKERYWKKQDIARISFIF